MSEKDALGKPEQAAEVKKAKKPAYGIATSAVRKKRQLALGAVLAPVMEPALAKQGVVLAQIAPHWRSLCPLLAAHSCPESVKGDTLTVAVASDGVKQELHYITPQIIEGITRLMGYSAIAKVRAITRHELGIRKAERGFAAATGSAAKVQNGAVAGRIRDKAETLCKSVRDDDLRAALGRLGAQILKEDQKK